MFKLEKKLRQIMANKRNAFKKRKVIKKVGTIKAKWLLQLKDEIEDNLIDAERKEVRDDILKAKAELSLINKIIG